MKLCDRKRALDVLAEWRMQQEDIKDLIKYEGFVEFDYFSDPALLEIIERIPPVYDQLVDEEVIEPTPIDELVQHLQQRLREKDNLSSGELQMYAQTKQYFADDAPKTAADRHFTQTLHWYTDHG